MNVKANLDLPINRRLIFSNLIILQCLSDSFSNRFSFVNHLAHHYSGLNLSGTPGFWFIIVLLKSCYAIMTFSKHSLKAALGYSGDVSGFQSTLSKQNFMRLALKIFLSGIYMLGLLSININIKININF